MKKHFLVVRRNDLARRHSHMTVESAIAEAIRLTNKENDEFVVYEAVTRARRTGVELTPMEPNEPPVAASGTAEDDGA